MGGLGTLGKLVRGLKVERLKDKVEGLGHPDHQGSHPDQQRSWLRVRELWNG